MSVPEMLQLAGYPENFVVLDFETYFDKDYSIFDLKPWRYVTDDRFETIGCGTKYSLPGTSAQADFIWADQLVNYFKTMQDVYGQHLENVTIVIQNVQFDALVLQEHYKISPKYMIDLKHLDAHFDSRRSHKLIDMAKREKLPAKGDTKQFSGLHLADMTDEQKQAMNGYCINDVNLEYALFEKLLPYLTEPETELKIARHTIDLYLKPRLSFDFGLADELVEGMQAHIFDACEEAGVAIDDASGNLSFVEELQAVLPEGESVPVKPAKKPGKNMTALLGQPGVGPALAKTDDGCKLLLAHSDIKVRKLMEARQAVKSWPLHIKRVLAMRALATTCKGKLPVPLNYYGCHCVPGDAEVLTHVGWVRLDQWDGGHIMQWKPEDGSMYYDNAWVNIFDNDEDSIDIVSPYISASFTKGHTIPRFGTGAKSFMPCKAGELLTKGTSYLPISGVSCHTGAITPDQMRVLVAVQADGHWQLETKFGRELRFGLTKLRKICRFREIFKAAGIIFRENRFPSHPGETTFRMRWADLPDWLSPDRKIFGAWLLNSTPDARLAFIKELRHWDGHQSGNLEYYSMLCPNHEWVATIAHLTGYGAKRGKNGTTIIRTTRDPQKAIVKKNHVSSSGAITIAYCPTTVTGYWLMRQNGTISITGNTGRWSGGGGINLLNLGGKGRAGQGTHPLISKMRELLYV